MEWDTASASSIRGLSASDCRERTARPRPSGSPSPNCRRAGRDSMSFVKPNVGLSTWGTRTKTWRWRYAPEMEIGIALSSEEQTPADLVRTARKAEEAGLGFGLISDHIHPWIDARGHSGFVWAVLGAIAQETESFRIGTGVTCPTMRIHPAIVAHAAATVACLMPGRFFLGVGTGENLNEHVLGAKWPAPDERLEMLEEAVEVIRLLWQGGYQTHRGKHYTVEQARIYTLPEQLPEVCVAAAQPNAAELAGRIGDGFIGVAPEQELIENFEQAGGKGKPRYGHLTACWAAS